MNRKGTIGVSTQDLFPIIKKFLYSDHEIFLREIISNAVDATQKLRALAAKGEYKGTVDDLNIHVSSDTSKGTITVSDNGIGMTAEEVEKYINQIAFSGAEEFLKKYKDTAASIIGHFGLGFYSSFMVSDKVEIVTRSYREGEKAVRWVCEGTTDYTMEETLRDTHGTDIIMYLNKDELAFAGEEKIEELLRKYCRFLPVEIIHGKEKEWKDGKYIDTDKEHTVNDTKPLWTRKPVELTKEDYDKFYHELYPYAPDPLFYIHLNVDFPFTLTGILYFPKIENRLELTRNKIGLYANQVYVTDSVEGIVPDYLTLLHGVIDSPDIPLNVSRSYLQSDRSVKQISTHITKKVADMLLDLYRTSRAEFEKKWDDLKIFVQYGVLSDEKFAEKAVDLSNGGFYLLKNVNGKYYGINDYTAAVKDIQTDKDGKTVLLYTYNAAEQYAYIESAKTKGYDVLVMNSPLDTPFFNYIEQKNDKLRFVRVDSEIAAKLVPADNDTAAHNLSEEDEKTLRELFNGVLPSNSTPASDSDAAPETSETSATSAAQDLLTPHYSIEFSALGENSAPAVITRSEFMRRMKEMSDIQPAMSFYGKMGDQLSIVINTDSPAVRKILSAVDKENIDKKEIAGQIIDLALLSNGLLKGEALAKFLRRSASMLE
ncbi:MAG: molecular chaperone HtpG [Bacteroidales bacterium]|nr:molecular chaperone HtpG [Bacteroidales bacterium]